ncbi:silent information regulator protein Sir2 [Bacillus sp. V3-13]|uniref:polysaccharide lyase 8 family protein n=1 Tax=Bacillus sp. V3-13 TaxID=2053728 RepID=UPI000C76A90A|nr:polysaccharide lyase 8 family protein [Bacillus sp. V3-13]PLR76286.1 silent information regulator protein Sir2 [Bacillus sp. V3-13]
MEKNLKRILASSLTLTTFLTVPFIESNNNAQASEKPAPVTAKAAVHTGNTDVLNELDQLKLNFREYLAGNESMNNSYLLDSKINTVHNLANTRLASFLSSEDRVKGEEKFLFENLVLGEKDANLSNSYLYLYQMALAAKTYKRLDSSGVNLYENQELIYKVIDGLEWLYSNFFVDQGKGYYGNWYSWEIGMPMNITKTLLLLEDEIKNYKPELIDDYIESMDLYLRNGKNGDIDLTSRFHTGANLADIATNRIIQGVLVGDEERVSKAVDHILTVFKTVDPNNLINGIRDGFYEDGSFIQHHRVAYTGSYGKVLLNRMIQTMNILADSKYNSEELLVPTVKDWIYKGFSPVIFEGYMMEIVKGRAVSRTGTGYQDVNSIVEAMVDLTNYLDKEDSKQLKSHIKYIADTTKGTISTGSFTSYASILNFNQLMTDPEIEAKNGIDEANHYAFNLMDKTVHVRDSYAFAFSRSSKRISKYEYMSGENLMPWFQGDGAYYLYLSGSDQTKSFGANFFATIDPYKLPGTTVPVEERKTIPELYGGKLFYENTDHPLNFYASSESQNDYVYFPVGTNTYSGGVKLGKYGVSGIQLGDEIGFKDKQKGLLPEDFVVYKNAEANKSAFMFDDEIVLMGSGIQDKMGREVISTIDNRMFDGTDTSSISGETYDEDRLIEPANGEYNLKWIHFKTKAEGTQVGYYFPDASRIGVTKETVSKSLRKIRTGNPDTKVTKNFFTLDMGHGKNPQKAKYAHVILPNFDEKKTEQYAANPNVKVLSNTEDVHAVENTKLGIKGFNFFSDKKKTVSNLTSYNQASILVKKDGDTVTIAISDPTFSLDKMKLKVEVPNPTAVAASDGVKISVSNEKALIHIDSKNSNGKSYEIKLKIKE